MASTETHKKKPVDSDLSSAPATVDPHHADHHPLATVGWFTLDSHGRLVEANRATAQMLGRPLETLPHRMFSACILPADREIHAAFHEQLLASGQPQECELRLLGPQGSVFLAYCNGTLNADQDGMPRVHMVLIDITQRRKTEDALQESEERYRQLVQNANSAIIRWKEDGTILFFNAFAEHFFGYPAAEIVGKPINLLLPEQDFNGSDLSGLTEDIVRHPDRYLTNQNENLCRDGRRVWVHWTNKAICDDHGEVREILSVGNDITPRKRMEEALRASQATLEAALASMTDAVFIADTDGRLVRFNDAFAVFHKFPDKNDCPRTLAEYLAVLELSSADGEPMPPENWPVMRALRGEAVSNAEYTLRRRDTTQTWMGSYSFGPIRDKRGTIIGAVVSVRDISEQKRLEADRQRQYSTLQGINHLLAATLNCQTEQELGAICLEIVQQLTASDFGFIGEVNDRGLHDIAISDPGWAACSIADNGNRYQPPGNFKLHGLYGRVLLDGQSLFTNDPANHPDRIGFPPGHPPVETFLGVPLRQNGKVIGMVGVANRANGYTQAEQETLEALAPVIVEAFMRKRAEVALRAGEERLRLAQEAAQAGSWEWDVLTGGMAWSEELWHLYGLEPGSAEPSPALWRQVVHPEDIQRVERTIRHAVVGGGEINTEWRVVTSSGDCRWLMSRGKPILDDAGRATRYLGIVIDITSRKQAEILRENEVGLRMAQQQLQVANEDLGRRVAQRTLELEETQKKFLHAEKLSAIGKLSASIAHEFNNPLQGILSVLKGLKKRAILEAEDRELLEAAIAESDRIKELIRGLQDFNRPSSGRKTLMDVHRSLNSLLLLHKSDFKEKRIVLQRNFADNLPQIMAVPDQIKQVLLNLLTNAADACHHPGGMITITTWHDDQQVAIAIQDTGSGIGPEELELIFQPFYTSKPEVKGTGLGLSVSYGIVKHHGGEILVDSAPGVGSTFTVRLPINGPLEQSASGD